MSHDPEHHVQLSIEEMLKVNNELHHEDMKIKESLFQKVHNQLCACNGCTCGERGDAK